MTAGEATLVGWPDFYACGTFDGRCSTVNQMPEPRAKDHV